MGRLSIAVGESRFGQQPTEIFFTSLMNDYAARTTYGSIMNDIGNLTQYDNDISYRSPLVANCLVYVSAVCLVRCGRAGGARGRRPLTMDHLNGVYRAGYAWRMVSRDKMTDTDKQLI